MKNKMPTKTSHPHLNTATTSAADDWMPQHCLPQNHDDFSFTPLQLSHSSSLSSSDEEVSLPLPPSRVVRRHHYPLNNNNNYYHMNGGRASSPSSVSAFPPPSTVKKRRRPRDNKNDGAGDPDNIVNRMEALLPICGTPPAAANGQEGATAFYKDDNDGAVNDQVYHRFGERGVTRLQRGDEMMKEDQFNMYSLKRNTPLREQSANIEDSVSQSQFPSGMEFLTMITCGLLHNNATANKEGV